ncbi:uncharacterized protein LOC123213481 isoform X2 [Mangifera indica]|uniref:uncharacterized protein LOC123213481 isoform X2 n=1 Tax=Mangifera indica TaxID=29780 RepID=UPI001CFAFA13|nr:uncharacterized protein LOC123213481 isoform X2 [Mangifera indica]
MPPSPALKCSPGRELRGENHKRGRSIESGLLFKDSDDNLALFNELQTKEKESFLLQPTEDFEETFTTNLRRFSDFKLGIAIPARGESSEPLNADGEKNDYDWLLTPPDTPLFPSLDDEPPLVNVARRGRPQSQPISISRSSTMEKSYRSNRGSASPNRLSPSPRSGNNSFQSARGRPSSSPHSSPTPAWRPATPTRRSSPPPSKTSTHAPRSLTPTPQRMNIGSRGSVASSVVRGTSPIRTSRGNSASPKIRAWQSTVPGFSLEAPPNLRTSLADRPASYVRGSSPASRNGRDSSSKFGRQSMSPTASRSVSSSHSHDRDRFSSQSKGSVASSGDDDIDSLQSVPMGISDSSVSRRVSSFSNNRAPALSKKSPKMVSASSAPKRSFDSALHQMDHRKSPQNMFRPLLSTVPPSSTFYVGKGNSANHSLMSRNSSVTTSSNASSDQGTIVAHDNEGSDHHQDDMTSNHVKVPYLEVQEESFAFDKVDSLDEEVEHERHDKSSNLQLGGLDREPAIKGDRDAFEEFSYRGSDMETNPTTNDLFVRIDSSEVGSFNNLRLCSTCGLRYCVTEPVEGEIYLCPDCRKPSDLVAAANHETTILVAENFLKLSKNISDKNKSSEELKPPVVVPEVSSQVFDLVEPRLSGHEENAEQSHTSYSEQSERYSQENSLARSVIEGGEEKLNYQQEIDQPTAGHDLPGGKDNGGQQLQLSKDYIDRKVDSSEGAGISLLLKRSSSSKGPVFQGRTFTAATIPYEDLSCTRDTANSLRSSMGHGSASAPSSVDFSSSRQTESRVQRQLSSRKSDTENHRDDVNTKPQSMGLSLSGSSSHNYQAFGLERSIKDISVSNMKYNDVEGSPVTFQSELISSEYKEAGVTYTSVPEEGNLGCNESTRTMDAATSELKSHMASCHCEQNSAASFPNYEEHLSYENGEDIPDHTRSLSDVEVSVNTPESSDEEEHTLLNSSHDAVDIADVSPTSISIINEFQEPSVRLPSDNDMSTVPESSPTDNAYGILEESIILVESQGGSKARSLTLEEATDAILFCSSIVHDMAFRAVTLAIEKESSVPVEGSWPTVTILGKSSSDRKNQRGRTAGKHTSKSQKARQRRVETNAKLPPSSETENDENADVSVIRNVGLPNKVDSMEPPKLESKCNCTIM